MKYTFIIPDSFEKKLLKISDLIIGQFEKELALSQKNPKHKSLRSTPRGPAIWSSSINMSYRFTWEYGPNKSEITLRQIGTHKIYKTP